MAALFRPRLWDALRDYRWSTFRADALAGLTVAAVALPLAMAFAIGSGVKPEAGLITAVIAGFLISALGGSRVQIGGPTGAFVVIVLGVVVRHGVENLALCTMMAGAMLVVLGATGLGSMIKFIPFPVTAGFTNGIAVLIVSMQLKDLLGLKVDSVPAEFFPRMAALMGAMPSCDGATAALGALALGIVAGWPARWGRVIPGSIVALFAGTLVVAWFGWPTETIGTRFGGVPLGWPPLRWPDVSWDRIETLMPAAVTIALLGGIESLLSAVVADGMTDDRHDSNQELMAQGIANMVAPLWGGIPATGAIARTATNVRTGAQTPVAGMIHALVVAALLVVAAPLAYHVPLTVLSAVLVVVGIKMGEWNEFRMISRYPKSDSAVFLVTFALTVAFDLTVAVEVGVVLAALLFIRRVADATNVQMVDAATETEGAHHSVLGKEVPPGVMVFRIFGAFLFGAADKLETALRRAQQEPDILILRLRKVIAMDATALNALESLRRRLARRGKILILCGAQAQPAALMERAGFFDDLGRDNVCLDLDGALARARAIQDGARP